MNDNEREKGCGALPTLAELVSVSDLVRVELRRNPLQSLRDAVRQVLRVIAGSSTCTLYRVQPLSSGGGRVCEAIDADALEAVPVAGSVVPRPRMTIADNPYLDHTPIAATVHLTAAPAAPATVNRRTAILQRLERAWLSVTDATQLDDRKARVGGRVELRKLDAVALSLYGEQQDSAVASNALVALRPTSVVSPSVKQSSGASGGTTVSTLTKQQMRSARDSGSSDLKIGKQFGVSRQRVSQLIGTKTANRTAANARKVGGK